MRMMCRETILEAEGSPGMRAVSVMFSSSRREGYCGRGEERRGTGLANETIVVFVLELELEFEQKNG